MTHKSEQGPYNYLPQKQEKGELLKYLSFLTIIFSVSGMWPETL